MSARQNKKQRKGRNNANNRERTVTTLTEDPNTPYLVPTPSEEPAGAAIMSPPFSVTSSSAGNPNNIPSTPYPLPGNFAFGYNSFVGPVHGNVHHQQQQFYPPQKSQQIILPPGQNDLEVLEKLKDMIKNGQHEFYRAVPQPAALASIYLGPNTTSQSQVPHHPEQPPDTHHGNAEDGPPQVNALSGSVPSSPVDLGRRPPRIQSKEGWDPSGPRKPAGTPAASGSQPTNNVLSAPSRDQPSPANRSKFSQSNQTSQTYSSHYQNNRSGTPATTNITNTNTNDGKANSAGGPGLTSSIDLLHSSGVKPSTITTATGGPDTTPLSLSSPKYESASIARSSGGPTSGSGNNSDQTRLPGESTYSGGPKVGSGDSSPEKSSRFDIKDEVLRPRESGWPTREGATPSEERRREHTDRPSGSPTTRANLGGTTGSGDRSIRPLTPPFRDERYYDRERERDRERDRDRRDWDRDRERDRRPYDRFRDRMTDARRPPPEQRHYEPDYDRPPIPRRFDPKVPEQPLADIHRPPDSRPPPPSISSDDRDIRSFHPSDDRLPPSTRVPSGVSHPPVDTRLPHTDTRASIPDARAQPPDKRPIRGPIPDDRHERAPLGDDRRRPLPADDRITRPPAPVSRPADVPGASRTSADDHSGMRAPLPLPQEERSSRPPVPLEERISPSLRDRLSQPPTTRSTANHLNRQASLEERLSHPLAASGDHGGRPIPPADDRMHRPGNALDRDRVTARPGPPDERNSRGIDATRPPLSQDERSRVDERPGRPADRYGRPPTPSPSDSLPLPLHRSTYPPPRSASVAHEDPRASRILPSPPPRPPSRGYRPLGRPASRERPEIRTGGYRPEDRSYRDDRRSDVMDIDPLLPRYSDSRAPYRPFSPPSAADLARDRARTQFPLSPPRGPASSTDAPPYDDPDKRPPAPGGRDWHYPPYSERRREWNNTEEESYWKTRSQWDRNNPPSDRDRFERDGPPAPPVRNHGWETRDERDRRDSFPRPSSPSRPFDGPLRTFDGPPRPLSSRLTDNYSSSAPGSVLPEDRSYPPPQRERIPLTRGLTPPFNSRVRQRSPSPIRRLGPGPVDDSRPPLKRPRDDGYSSGYYSPPRDTLRRRSIDYPSRGSSPGPPPPSSGSSYYDRGPPPLSTSTAASIPSDRDYPGGRDRGAGADFGPAPSYERSRSPGAARGYSRGGYVRGGDSRDDRRYPPPPMHPPRRP